MLGPAECELNPSTALEFLKLLPGAVAEGNAIFCFSAPHDSPSPSCL